MIQKAQIKKKKKQQPNLKLDQHKLTKTTDEAIRMKSLQEKQPRTHHSKLQKQGKGRER